MFKTVYEHRQARLILVILFSFILSMVLIGSLTARGAGVSMDSMFYISAAQNMLHGHGLSLQSHAFEGDGYRPITTWPPLYPLALSAVMKLTGNGTEAVPYLNILLLSLTLMLLIQLVYEVSGRFFTGLVMVTGLALYPIILMTHSFVWSEVLFLPLILAAYLYIYRDLKQPQSTGTDLYIAVIFLAAAFYTRYSAGAFLIAAIATQFIGFRKPGNRHWHRSILVVSLFTLLTAPLLIHNFLASGHISGADRQGTSMPGIFSDLPILFELVVSDLFTSGLVATIFCITIVGAIISRQQSPHPHDRLALFMPLIWIVSYLVFLLVARQIQNIDLDARMLMVVYPLFFLLIAGLLPAFSSMMGKFINGALFILLLMVTSYHLKIHDHLMQYWVHQDRQAVSINGIGYPSITDSKFIYFSELGERFPLAEGGYVFTDHERPIVFDYYFPNARVVSLNQGNLHKLYEYLGQDISGLLVMVDGEMQSRLDKEYIQGKQLYKYVISNDMQPWLVVKL